MMKKLTAAIITALLLLCALSGCAAGSGEVKDVPARDIFDAMTAALEGTLPASIRYYSGAADGDDGYYDEIIRALDFGDGVEAPAFDLVTEYAISLPEAKSTIQYAVFKVASAADLDTVKTMAEERVERVRTDPNIINYDTDGSMQKIANEGSVYTEGNYVFILMTADNAAARAAADSKIK